MQIRFERLISGQVVYSEVDTEKIIQGCFEPCTVCVQRKIESWLADERRQRFTLKFTDMNVRLTKKEAH